MYSFIQFFSYTFDMVISVLYLNGILKKRKESVNIFFFFCSFLFMELALFVNEHLCAALSADTSLIVTSLVSLLTMFTITFLYQASIANRIFVSLCFQVLVLLGEACFTLLAKAVNPSIFDMDMSVLSIIMNFGSKFTLFLLSLIVILFWNFRIRYRNVKYNILLFATPITTLIIMLCTSLKNNLTANNDIFITILFTSLSILNIVNYFLLEDYFMIQNTKKENEIMQRQIHFQQEKYYQLGSAYKENRHLLHDVKKHYFALNEYIQNGQYDEAKLYLNTAINDIKTVHLTVNSGNLVIDSFISNFKLLAKHHNFQFVEDISIQTERIPISDYDLCTIIGNLLDNAFDAVCKDLNPKRYVHITIYSSDTNTFLIHTKNSCMPNTLEKHSSISSLEHGYGLNNIQRIVDDNKGIMRCTRNNDEYEVIISIPITS